MRGQSGDPGVASSLCGVRGLGSLGREVWAAQPRLQGGGSPALPGSMALGQPETETSEETAISDN